MRSGCKLAFGALLFHFALARAAALPTDTAWLEGFQRDGFVAKLGSLPEVLRQRLRNVVERMEIQGRDFNKQVINAHLDVQPELMEVASDPAVLDAVQQVVGADVLLVSTAFFAKYPKDGNLTTLAPKCLSVVGVHQDRQYWEILPYSAPVVSVWVAVDDVDIQNGAMRFFAGTHKEKLHHDKHVGNCSALMSGQNIPQRLLPDQWVDIELRSGEYTLFDGMLAHGSGQNRSPRRRMGLTMVYAASNVEYKPMGYSDEEMESFAGDWRIPSVLVRGSAERVQVPFITPGEANKNSNCSSFSSPDSTANVA